MRAAHSTRRYILMHATNATTRLAGPASDAPQAEFDSSPHETSGRLEAWTARTKSAQHTPNPLALGGVWWQRPPWSLSASLARAHEVVQAAEKLFSLATADGPPPPSVPMRLVYALDDMRNVMPLKGTLVDAASVGDVASMDRCLEIASRMASLARAYTGLTDRVLERNALRPVSAWLLQAADALKRALKMPLCLEAPIVAKLAGTDGWLPPLTVARIAGEVCSAALLDRAWFQALRAFEQGLCIDISECNLPQLRSVPLGGRNDSIWTGTFVLAAFARGVIDQSSAAPPSACADLHEGPMPMLVHKHMRAMDTLEWHARLEINTNIIDTLTAWLARAVDNCQGTARDVVAYVLASLAAARSASTDPVSAPKKMTAVALRIASILGDPNDRARPVVLDGLGISPTKIRPAGRPCSLVGTKRCHQSDLLTLLWNHHPLLVVEMLSHVDAWDIGSVALTSTAHYARIIEAIQEDDTRFPRRLSSDIALAGTIWLRQRHCGIPCDPESESVTPSFSNGPLSGLRTLLFMCRRMPLVASVMSDDEAIARATLAMACALECGAAMEHCARWLDAVPRLDWQRPVVYDGPPGGVTERLQYSTIAPRALARQAGLLGSPMLMRVAYSAWPRDMPNGEATVRFMDKRHTKWIPRLMDGVVDGIKTGLGRLDDHNADLILIGLPTLVEVICGLLAAVRHDVDVRGPLPHYRTKFKKELHGAGFEILAPGVDLAMPKVRTRLALALFETASHI